MSNNIKDNVQSGEVFSLNSEVHEDAGFGFYGHTKISVTRAATGESEVIKDDHNLIVGGAAQSAPTLVTATGLKSYFAHSMSSNSTNGALVTADLFAADGASNGMDNSTIDTGVGFKTKHGIIISASGSLTEGIFAMVTTEMTASNSYGRKWKGVFVADIAGSFTAATIGNNLKTDLSAGGANITSDVFTIPYATQTFTTQLLGPGDTLTIEWEIYIA